MSKTSKFEQYPLKEMTIKEYDLAKKEQFGVRFPSMDTSCKVCSKSYGSHYGLTCPQEDK